MATISNKELLASLAKARPDQPANISPDERECLALSIYGNEVEEEDPLVYAKIVRNGVKTSFWILYSPNHRMFNPYSLTADEYKRQRKVGQFRQSYKMKETNEKIFRMYVEFLRTQNPSYLLNAEREDNV